MNTEWPQELIDKYGRLPIWTATWSEYYVQYYRFRQTFVEADELARAHNGQVVLTVRQYSGEKPG